MKSSRDKLDLSAAGLESTPAPAPGVPQRDAHERSPAILERALGVHQHAAAGYAIPTSRTGASDRKSYFARLLEALHDSRRLQALRVIRHYGHLIQEGRKASPNDRPEIASASNPDEANGDYSRVPRPRPAMSFGVRMLTAIAVIGFGILHLIGGARLSHGSNDRPTQNSISAIHGH
jgi:hypothetical protein